MCYGGDRNTVWANDSAEINAKKGIQKGVDITAGALKCGMGLRYVPNGTHIAGRAETGP